VEIAVPSAGSALREADRARTPESKARVWPTLIDNSRTKYTSGRDNVITGMWMALIILLKIIYSSYINLDDSLNKIFESP